MGFGISAQSVGWVLDGEEGWEKGVAPANCLHASNSIVIVCNPMIYLQ
jgi:hypothetical protein